MKFEEMVLMHFFLGQTCLVIEDLVTTGGSAIEVAESLRSEGLVTKKTAIFLSFQHIILKKC